MPLQDVESWFVSRGTPHFIDRYSASRDVFTRALPALTAIFLFELAGAFNADWVWWQNVLAAAGGLLVLIGTWAAVNTARDLPPFTRPARVGAVELTVFVVVPGLIPVLFGGQVGQAVGVAAGNLVLLGLIYAVTSYALFPLTRWAAVTMGRQLGAVFGLLARALPMLLLVDVFLFLNPDTWQTAAALEPPFLAATGGLFVALGAAFLFTRLPAEISRLATFTSAAELEACCVDTPADGVVARAGDAALRPWPLGRRQRGNVALVVVVSEAIQVVLVAVVIGLFFVVFGLVVVRPPVLVDWLGYPVDPLATLSIFGEEVLLTAELLRVAGFLAAFSGFYFTVYVITDATYRKEFFEEVVSEVRQSLAVRAVYLALLDQSRDEGGHGAGRSAATPSKTVTEDGTD